MYARVCGGCLMCSTEVAFLRRKASPTLRAFDSEKHMRAGQLSWYPVSRARAGHCTSHTSAAEGERCGGKLGGAAVDAPLPVVDQSRCVWPISRSAHVYGYTHPWLACQRKATMASRLVSC